MIDQVVLGALLTMTATLYGGMEGFGKPAIRRIVAAFNKMQKRYYINELTQFAIFRIMAVLAGVVMVAGVDGVSLGHLAPFAVAEQYADAFRVFDVLATGVAIGLGNKSVHFVVDIIEVWLNAKAKQA